MQIYFEDGKLLDSKRLSISPDYTVDASDGVTSCINQLDNISVINSYAVVYTNSIFALNGKYVWNKESNMHDIFIRDNANGCFKRIANFTARELREGHNIGKMYVAGEFD